MKLKTYVINLKHSTEKRRRVLEELANFPYLAPEIIEGIDGKRLDEEEKCRLYDRKRFISRYGTGAVAGEIGCMASHLKCYHYFLSTGEGVALILEDDVHVTRPELMEPVLKKGCEWLEDKKPRMLLLTPFSVYRPKGDPVTSEYAFHPVLYAKCSCAYLINRKAAERLTRWSKVEFIADDYEAVKQKGIEMKILIPSITVGLSSIREVPSELSYDETAEQGHRWKYRLSRKFFFLYLYLLARMGWACRENKYAGCEIVRKWPVKKESK